MEYIIKMVFKTVDKTILRIFFGSSVPINVRFFNICIIFFTLYGAFLGIFLSLFGIAYEFRVFCIATAIIFFLLFFWANVTKKHNFFITLSVYLFNMIFLPASYLFAGGITLGFIHQIAVGFLVTYIFLNDKTFFAASIIHPLWYITIFYLSYKNPGIIIDLMADLHFDDTHITHMIEILSFIFNMGLITAASALLIKALVIAFKEERRTSVNLLKELENLSVKDQITGLYNRRYMLSYLEDAIDDMHHENKPLSIIMFDIDKFKDKNDTHGHMTGDEILKNVACAIVENCRRSDIAARYGGDEFVVIMPGVSGTAAYISANRIREYIETKNIVPDIDIRITISGGVVSYEDDLNVAVLLEMADDNLYKAKNRGQNMIVWEQVYPISKYTGIHQ